MNRRSFPLWTDNPPVDQSKGLAYDVLPSVTELVTRSSYGAGYCLLTDRVVEDVLCAQIIWKHIAREHAIELGKRRSNYIVINVRDKVGSFFDLGRRLLAVVVVAVQERKNTFIKNAQRYMVACFLT